MERFVSQCRDQIEKLTAGAGGYSLVRSPIRPLAVTFLGDHPEEGYQRFRASLQIGWPASASTIIGQIQRYPTLQSFRQAIEEETPAQNNTRVEMSIQRAVQITGTPNHNLLMVYFLNINDADALEHIRLLDQEYTTPVGGDVERLIFAIGRTTSKRAYLQGEQFLNELASIANNPASPAGALWGKTSCVVLTDYLSEHRALSEPEYLDNYSLAMDILLLQYSVSNPEDKFIRPRMPVLTDDGDRFVSAALQRRRKPFEEIARVVLNTFLKKGAELAGGGNDGRQKPVDNAILSEEAVRLLENLYQNLLNARSFPPAEVISTLPNGACSATDVGIFGGDDRSCGVWEGFCSYFYSGKVRRTFGDKDELKKLISNYFTNTCRHTCHEMSIHFPDFRRFLMETDAVEFFHLLPPSGNDSLYAWGVYDAKRALAQLLFDALKDSVDELGQSAKRYTQMLSMLASQVSPTDQAVIDQYRQYAMDYMLTPLHGMGENTFDILKRPCSEAELSRRLDSFVEGVTRQPKMCLNFFEDLRNRSDASSAVAQLTHFLEVAAFTLDNDARIHGHFVSRFADASLYDATILGVASTNLFLLGGTNGIDRVALYSFREDGTN